MAHRAQAVISNMEFVQFHPTALADEGLTIKPQKTRENAFLIREAVRGDGGILYNLGMELDVVARGIDDQLKKRNENYRKTLPRFLNIASECVKCGLDITRQPIPVVPAAHYMCVGVRAGLQGDINVRGLYVAGEVACTGLHGGIRLASNSLLEALVFARRAVKPLIHNMKNSKHDHSASNWPIAPNALGSQAMVDVLKTTKKGGKNCNNNEKISELENDWERYLFQKGWEQTMVGLEACEMRNLFCCAKLVLSSALARHESRGLHYTIDYPHVEESKRLPTVIFPSSLNRGVPDSFTSRPFVVGILKKKKR
ncbi:hypothetical protein K2173_020237 [Erythroxylum novogranatense]|uniref:L-aspartate oxidase n=1 Tax=Erythroxylum novogranatense TaxID=1862640 RepID=A0AAV8UBU1_9ROSI|nr:hypothetical protein K2173_020237 [Erythroxylum novogranatense]